MNIIQNYGQYTVDPMGLVLTIYTDDPTQDIVVNFLGHKLEMYWFNCASGQSSGRQMTGQEVVDCLSHIGINPETFPIYHGVPATEVYFETVG